MGTKPTRVLVRAQRLARLALHLAYGCAIAALAFPLSGAARRSEGIKRWSAHLLQILSVRAEAVGGLPQANAAPTMMLANHVSWLDAFVLLALCNVRFIAKSDVRAWPVIGWLCARAGTLFVDRGRRQHTAHVGREMAAALERGDALALFPEGTTTTGDRVLPFHSSLLEPAVARHAAVQPLAIRYRREDGSRCLEASYAGTTSMIESLLMMVSQQTIHAQIEFLPPLASYGVHRRDLANAAACCIAAALGVSVEKIGSSVPGLKRPRHPADACGCTTADMGLPASAQGNQVATIAS